MLKFFSFIFSFFIFIATIAITIIALIALFGFIHPSFDFFNNLQPIIFGGTFFAVIFSAFFISKKAWRSLSLVIATLGFLSSAFIVVPDFLAKYININTAPPSEEIATYRLLTQNLFGRNFDSAKTALAIEKEDPDILVFQEYFLSQRKKIHPILIKNYPNFFICRGGKRNNVALYSKIKFTLDKKTSCAVGNAKRISRIVANFNKKNSKAFSVITTHLDWPLQVSKLDDGNNIKEALNLSVKRQQDQFSDLSKFLKQIKNPYIIAGDFNSTSWSYSLRNFAKSNDLNMQSKGFLTYPNRFYIAGWRDTIPLLSLDHIFTKPKIKVIKARKGKAAGSDHNPVIIDFFVE